MSLGTCIAGFQLILKSMRERWWGTRYDFYLLAHEHLYVFRKPATGERVTKFKNSVKWR